MTFIIKAHTGAKSEETTMSAHMDWTCDGCGKDTPEGVAVCEDCDRRMSGLDDVFHPAVDDD